MSGQRTGRRLALGIFMAALALTVVTLLGSGGASARNNDGGGLDDWGSKADFKEWCDLIGGGWIDAPADNMTICVRPDGKREVCDQNGGNCEVFGRTLPSSGTRGQVAAGTTTGVLVPDGAAKPPRVITRTATTRAQVSLDDDDQP